MNIKHVWNHHLVLTLRKVSTMVFQDVTSHWSASFIWISLGGRDGQRETSYPSWWFQPRWQTSNYSLSCIISPNPGDNWITLICLSMVPLACRTMRRNVQNAQSKAHVLFRVFSACVSGDWFLHEHKSAGIFFPGKVGGLSIILHQDAIAESKGCIWDPYKPWKLIPKTWYIDTS